MEFITSNKGSLKLLYQGFSYVKQKDLVDNVVSYECVRRRSANGTCKARIHIRDDEVVGEVGDHTHQPNPAGTETLKVVAAMKHRPGRPKKHPSKSLLTVSQDCILQRQHSYQQCTTLGGTLDVIDRLRNTLCQYHVTMLLL